MTRTCPHCSLSQLFLTSPGTSLLSLVSKALSLEEMDSFSKQNRNTECIQIHFHSYLPLFFGEYILITLVLCAGTKGRGNQKDLPHAGPLGGRWKPTYSTVHICGGSLNYGR